MNTFDNQSAIKGLARPKRVLPRQGSRQRGLSLVEIMVAVTLSLVLAAGVGQIYVANKQSYRLQDAQGRIQENGRYALEIMARDIRQAGYLGCVPRRTAANVVAKYPPGISGNSPAFVASSATGIVGYDSSATANPSWAANDAATPVNVTLGANQIPAVLGNNPIKGTDIVSVQFGVACGGRLLYPVGCTVANCAATASGDVTPVATNTCGASASASCGSPAGCNGDVYVISNCATADVFRASSVGGATGAIGHSNLTNTSGNFAGSYDASAELMIFRSYSYYIAMGEANEPSLFRYDNTAQLGLGGNNPVELVEGVEDMQIFYGVDTDATADNSANQYVTANLVSNWSRVASVRIVLTLRSVGEEQNNLTQDPRPTFFFNGASVANDRHFTRSFSTTVGIRNSL